MTLDQIVERTKLPIRVEYVPADYQWIIHFPKETSCNHFVRINGYYWADEAADARFNYLQAVSEIYVPGSMR